MFSDKVQITADDSLAATDRREPGCASATGRLRPGANIPVSG